MWSIPKLYTNITTNHINGGFVLFLKPILGVESKDADVSKARGL